MTFASDELKEMRLRVFLLAFFFRIFFLLVNVAVRVYSSLMLYRLMQVKL